MGMCIQHSFFRYLKLLTILGSLICTSSFHGSSAAGHFRPQRKLQSGSGRSDMQALLQFKSSLTDTQSSLSSWTENSNGNPCNWKGITCNSEGRVTQITLSGLNLNGHFVLAQLLEYMEMLKGLDLSNNDLQGNLTLGTSASCGSLLTLNISYNSIDGFLPAELLKTCSGIQVLDLSHNNITGSFPQDFFSSCGSLKTLDLFSNRISGSLPSGIGSCATLQSLVLSANSLSGPIAESVFSKCEGVTSIDLSLNALSGEIPASLATCSELRYLNLSNNRIGRGLPSSLGDLMSITTLDISNNTLNGEIPDELGRLCLTLDHLDLSLNNLSGNIPSAFGSCASLQQLNLASNNLSGSFPTDVVTRMKNLQVLKLTFNQLTGPLPTSLAQLPRTLKVLDLGSNRLSGSIPSVICGPSSTLEKFMIPNNLLTGEIPAAIGNCSQLTHLHLSFNRLEGSLPEELGQLSSLESISIWFNQLTGEIPKTIGRLSKLKILILNDNLLSGPIPAEISNCSSLEWLSLANNKLSGSIPPSIGSMAQLTLLELGSNSLSGHIPPEMVNASKFVWLDLHSNTLTGPIPPGLGRHPNAEPATRVTGVVFAFIRNNLLMGCRGMGTLLEFDGITDDALEPTPLMAACNSSRLYMGDVLNKDPDLSSVQFMDLSYNSLEGTIPEEIGSLTALAMLSLGHNQLVGDIPETFKNLTALGVLDLSYNKLEGSLSPLAYSNFLVQIDVSHNNFSGTIPATGQLPTATQASFDGNPFLCGEPLPKCGAYANNGGSDNCTLTDSCNSHSRMGVMPWANSLVLGILIAVAFMCMLIVWGIMMRAKGKQKDADNMLTNLQLGASCNGNSGWNLGGEKEPLSINVATFERPLRKLTFAQLIEATNGFSQESLIGIGGFGEVYRAELKDGSTVAIKKLLQFSYQGDREFTAEMETLGKIKHRNLVPLLGYCKVGEERLLVYEYMQNGSLDDMLHSESKMKEQLTWELRKQIARGAARGLAFLHHNCIPHIIHRDMKSSNVLLDKNLEARVSDFGMARLISALDTHLSVSTLAGTPGYVPPEYYQSFRCTTKGDIYSFGVILLELLTGKRPTDKEFFEDTNLVGWVKQLVNEKKSLDVLDPSLKGNANDEIEMLQYLRIACDCLHDQSSKRPSMLEVVSKLKELQVHEETH